MTFFDQIAPFREDSVWTLTAEAQDFLLGSWIERAHPLRITFNAHLEPFTGTFVPFEKAMHAFLGDQFRMTELKPMNIPDFGKGGQWTAMSAMQKAIRRNEPDLAERIVRAMIQGGAEKSCIRRLAVTVMEDIGLANPYLVALTFQALFGKETQAAAPIEVVATWLAREMAVSPKSRDLCDVIVAAGLRGGFEEELKDALTWDDARAVEVFADQGCTFTARFLAHFRMFGPKLRIGSARSPVISTAVWSEAYQLTNMPVLIAYLSRRPFLAHGDAMCVPVPLIWQRICASSQAWTGDDPFEICENEKIGHVHAATFDKHTWQGKAAIKKLLAEGESLRFFLQSRCIPESEWLPAFERAVFYVEGAILRPRLYYDGAETVFWDILDIKTKTNGFANLEEAKRFYDLMQAQLPRLNKLRDQKIADAM